MFARRHPLLFFTLIMFSCFTIVFIGFVILLSSGAKIVNTQLAGNYKLSQGNIGVVEIKGVIFESKKIIEQIRDFREDNKIKAIVLRIDSPGGGIGPSQEIYREILKTRADKKVVTSMGSVAASGGYYIASASEGIVANPGTITGSIGVIMEYANLMEVAKKIGIAPVVIKSGKFKDIGSPLRELGDKEKELLQALVDELHEQFVSDTAKARNIPFDRMSALADGRIYTGQNALNLNLVDRLGNLGDAVNWAGELAGITEELRPVYPPEDKMTFIRKLAETLLKDFNISGSITNDLRYIIN